MNPVPPTATLPVVFDVNKSQTFYMLRKASGTSIITVSKGYQLIGAKYNKKLYGAGETILSFYGDREYPNRLDKAFPGVTLQEHNQFCDNLHQHFYDAAFVERI